MGILGFLGIARRLVSRRRAGELHTPFGLEKMYFWMSCWYSWDFGRRLAVAVDRLFETERVSFENHVLLLRL